MEGQSCQAAMSLRLRIFVYLLECIILIGELNGDSPDRFEPINLSVIKLTEKFGETPFGKQFGSQIRPH